MSEASVVVTEFGGNKVALAAGISGILLDASPPDHATRPIGFQLR